MWSILWKVEARVACGRALGVSAAHRERAMEQLQTNPYYEKYAARIAELQRADPEEFQRRAQAVAPEPPRRAPAPSPAAPAAPDVGRYAALLRPKEPAAEAVAPAPAAERRLDAIFKTELVADKEAGEIRAIWEQYHRLQPAVAAVVPLEAHQRAMERAARFPTFVVPLPRAEGYELFLLQAAGRSVHFTPLLAFQVHKENAPECLTMTHYTELSHKGIVLMRGEYDKNVLSGTEARCLVNQFQLYYSGQDEARLKLLETFTERPDSFKHMDLIAQLENITLE